MTLRCCSDLERKPGGEYDQKFMCLKMKYMKRYDNVVDERWRIRTSHIKGKKCGIRGGGSCDPLRELPETSLMSARTWPPGVRSKVPHS